MKEDHRLYARLLSERPGMSIPEKETVLANVLAHVEQEEPPQSVRSRATLPRLVKAASLIIVILIAIPIVMLTRSTDDSQFREKGAGDIAPLFSVQCVARTAAANSCRSGDKLVFNVRPPVGKTHFSAFAQRKTDGAIIWYFPERETSRSIDIAPNNDAVLSKGIILGPEHTTGRYRVYGVFSKESTTRQQIKSKFDDRLRLKDDTFAVSFVEFTME